MFSSTTRSCVYLAIATCSIAAAVATRSTSGTLSMADVLHIVGKSGFHACVCDKGDDADGMARCGKIIVSTQSVTTDDVEEVFPRILVFLSFACSPTCRLHMRGGT